METQDQQLDASAELHNDKSPNEEQPPAPASSTTAVPCYHGKYRDNNQGNGQSPNRVIAATKGYPWKKNEDSIANSFVSVN